MVLEANLELVFLNIALAQIVIAGAQRIEFLDQVKDDSDGLEIGVRPKYSEPSLIMRRVEKMRENGSF
jgi:hypothetical protein